MRTAKLLGLLAIFLLMEMSASAQILITASVATYSDAFALLNAQEQANIHDPSRPSFDASSAAIEPPKSETTNRSIADIYRIDWESFFKKINERASAALVINVIAVSRVQTLGRLLGDSGYSTPKFVVKLEWKSTSGTVHVACGQATGPSYKGRGDRTKNPEAIRSENIAFCAAFLKAVSQVTTQVMVP